MRILDRYITLSIVKIFVSTVFIFTMMYVLIDSTTNLEKYLDRQLPFSILIKYYLAYLPMILKETATFACLVSVLLTFSALTNNNEVIVMRASGLNFWQITRPALMFALIVTAMMFVLNERFVPKADQMTRQIKNEHIILKTDSIKKKRQAVKSLTFYGLKNRLYYVDTFDPNTDTLNGVTIIEYNDKAQITQKIIALEGKWTGIAWKFYQTQITSYGDGGISTPIKVKVYKEKLMDIKETPEDFFRQRIKVDSMNIKELADYIGRFSGSGARTAITNLKVDLHHKVSGPFGSFVIVLTGLPFAMMVKNRKGMTFTSVGIAMLIGFLYEVTHAVTLAFGKGGLLPPIFSAWAAPFLFVMIGILTIETYFSSS